MTTSLVLLAILHSSGGGAHADRAETLAPIVEREGYLDGVDPLIVIAIIERESNFRADIVSPDRKDIGLMGVRLNGAGRGYHLWELKDPSTNVLLGTRYYASRARVCRRTVGALSDYNAGPANRCHPNAYGRAVLKRYRALKKLTKTT